MYVSVGTYVVHNMRTLRIYEEVRCELIRITKNEWMYLDEIRKRKRPKWFPLICLLISAKTIWRDNQIRVATTSTVLADYRRSWVRKQKQTSITIPGRVETANFLFVSLFNCKDDGRTTLTLVVWLSKQNLKHTKSVEYHHNKHTKTKSYEYDRCWCIDRLPTQHQPSIHPSIVHNSGQ